MVARDVFRCSTVCQELSRMCNCYWNQQGPETYFEPYTGWETIPNHWGGRYGAAKDEEG